MKSDKVSLTYDLTYKDVVDILKIIDGSTSEELHLELENLKLDVIMGKGNKAAIAVPVPAAPKPQAPVQVPEKKMSADEKKPKAEAELSGIPIRSPLGGTFYRSPAPGELPFAKEGDTVKAGDQLGIVEVMKLMNSIRAPQDGVIKEVLVENESTVAMDQVLMLMEPLPKKKSKK